MTYRVWRDERVLFLGSVAVALPLSWALRRWGPDANPLAVAAVAAAVIGLSFPILLKFWTAQDEAVRTAHKDAWWWGGSLMIMLAYVPLVVFTVHPIALDFTPFDRSDPAAYVAAGAFGMVTLQVAGYLVALAAWWLSKR